MRNFKRMLSLFFIILLLYVVQVMVSTGFFRSIEPQFAGEILKEIALKGAEDMMVSQEDSFVLISATNRMVYPPVSEETGGLFLLDLKAKDFIPLPLTADFDQAFAPHGISFFKKDSTYQVAVINHTDQGHSIEIFELQDKKLTYLKTLRHPSMIRPNDLVLVDDNKFYFTNDHRYTEGLGNLAEEYLGLAISNVVYFDGKDYREVAKGIAYANGINYDQKRKLLYVASPRGFLVKVYTVEPDASLSFVEDIPCGTGVDNIELDPAGNLWIGAHPNLLRFKAYASGQLATSPSEILKVIYRKEGDYTVAKIYVEEGSKMSASTVAAPFGNLIFAGNVMDEEFLVLEQ